MLTVPGILRETVSDELLGNLISTRQTLAEWSVLFDQIGEAAEDVTPVKRIILKML